MTFETDLQAAQASGQPFRVVVDCAAKTKSVVYLSQEEIDARAARHAATEPARTASILARKRAVALKALDDERLAAAVADPTAPQAVKDYAALVEK